MTKDDLLRRALAVGFEYHDGRHADRCEACKVYLEIEAALAVPEPPVIRCAECGATPSTDVVVHWQHECTHDAETTTESTASVSLKPDESPAAQRRQTRYCDYDLCPATFDPSHSNNDH